VSSFHSRWLGIRSIALAMAVAAALFLPAGRGGAECAGPAPEEMVIDGGTLIDGTGRPPIENSRVVVRGNRISAAGRKGEVRAPKGATVVEASDKFIIPGLIDINVHYYEWQGELYLAHGVTTVKDTGNPIEWLEQMSGAISGGKIAGPRLFYTGNSLTSPPAVKDHHVCLTDEDMARRAVRILKEHGAVAVKVGQQISIPLLKAIAAEAHKLGMPVSGHLRMIGAREAAEAGIDGLEHTTGVPRSTGPRPDWIRSETPATDLAGYYDDLHESAVMDEARFASLIQLLIAKRVVITPTLFTWFRIASDNRTDYAREDSGYSGFDGLSYVPEKVLKAWRNPSVFDPPSQPELEIFKLGYKKVLKFLKEFHDAGGLLLAGSAPGNNVPGLNMLREMEALTKMGLTPAEVIEIATRRNSEFLRMDEEIGTVSPGKLADMVILDASPLKDIKNLRRIAVVIKDGKPVDRRYHSDYKAPIPRPSLTRPLWLDQQLSAGRDGSHL
jgi:hypothetical protein